MKITIILMCFLILLSSGCNDINVEKFDNPIPIEEKSIIIDEETTEKALEITPTPQAKITSDFENAPSLEQVSQETNKEISTVLLQDTQTYKIPMQGYFAVCLEEDAEKAYRWLYASEDGPYKYIEETHINGYRVFIFEPLVSGETQILFNLSQNSTLVEILSFQIVIS